MTWARASKADYAALVELGNKGWSWEDWLPYFLKSESMPEAYVKGSREEKEDLAAYDANEGAHSSEGRVKLGYVPWFGDTHRPFFRALEGLGVPSNPSSVRPPPFPSLLYSSPFPLPFRFLLDFI